MKACCQSPSSSFRDKWWRSRSIARLGTSERSQARPVERQSEQIGSRAKVARGIPVAETTSRTVIGLVGGGRG
jgi:hypothetical protein